MNPHIAAVMAAERQCDLREEHMRRRAADAARRTSRRTLRERVTSYVLARTR
jgi:hypothetical protein